MYRAVLLDKFGIGRRDRFIIRENLFAFMAMRLHGDETIQSRALQWRLNLKGLGEAAANDFICKNSEPVCLEQKLELPIPCILLSENDFNTIWNWPDIQSARGKELDGWKVFRERYLNACGLIHFSRIGFDTDEKQALVEVGIHADWLMGHGELVLLTQTNEGWKVNCARHTWVS